MTRDLLGLEGKWVAVTGGTRGIGRALAERLAEAGARVAVASRSGDDAAAVAAELERAHGGPHLGHACDVTRAGSVDAFFRAVKDASGDRLHGLVNNAGYPLEPEWWETPLHEVPPAKQDVWFRSVWDVDVHGARLCTHHALNAMMPRGGGSIVFVSSTPALSGFKGTPYTEAKAAVLGLMRDVAREYGRHGVRANAIAPGNVRTAWADTLSEADFRAAAEEAPLKRWGEPRDVANAMLFLLSDLGAFVTGQTLVVDGGTVMR